MMATCANCGQVDVATAECPRCGAILAKAAAHKAHPHGLPAPPMAVPPRSSLSTREKIELAAVPAALVLGALLQLTVLGRFVVAATAEMEMHELGHATAMWLAGRMAVPLPMVTLGGGLDRSVLAFALVALGLGLLGRAAHREHLVGLQRLALGLGCVLVIGTMALSGPGFDTWVKFAGMGGEFWLSAILLVAFHQTLPASWRWTHTRWFFLFWGALAFTADARRWIIGEVPWGSFWGGDGDMEFVRDGWHWSAAQIVHVYRVVGLVCFALIAAEVAVRARALRAVPQKP